MLSSAASGIEWFSLTMSPPDVLNEISAVYVWLPLWLWSV